MLISATNSKNFVPVFTIFTIIIPEMFTATLHLHSHSGYHPATLFKGKVLCLALNLLLFHV